jgi:hypothetical protein
MTAFNAIANLLKNQHSTFQLDSLKKVFTGEKATTKIKSAKNELKLLKKIKTQLYPSLSPCIDFYLRYANSYLLKDFLEKKFISAKTESEKIELLCDYGIYLQSNEMIYGIFYDDNYSDISQIISTCLSLVMIIVGAILWHYILMIGPVTSAFFVGIFFAGFVYSGLMLLFGVFLNNLLTGYQITKGLSNIHELIIFAHQFKKERQVAITEALNILQCGRFEKGEIIQPPLGYELTYHIASLLSKKPEEILPPPIKPF